MINKEVFCYCTAIRYAYDDKGVMCIHATFSENSNRYIRYSRLCRWQLTQTFRGDEADRLRPHLLLDGWYKISIVVRSLNAADSRAHLIAITKLCDAKEGTVYYAAPVERLYE